MEPEVKAARQEFKAQAKADETLGRLNIGEKSHLEGEAQAFRFGSRPRQWANGRPGGLKQGNRGPGRKIPVKMFYAETTYPPGPNAEHVLKLCKCRDYSTFIGWGLFRDLASQRCYE